MQTSPTLIRLSTFNLGLHIDPESKITSIAFLASLEHDRQVVWAAYLKPNLENTTTGSALPLATEVAGSRAVNSMTKINFSKVEKSFDQALQRLSIDRLSELATIANMVQDPTAHLASEAIEESVKRFQKELKKIHTQDPLLFEKLTLSSEEEERLNRPASEYSREDWLRLKALKVRIDELKHELYGQQRVDPESDHQIAHERRRHINKRFNVREGWLPLH